MGFFDTIKSSIGSSWLDLLVYVAILFVFVIGLIKCIFPVMNTRRLIQRAIRNIRAGDSARHSWQEDDFLGKGVLSAHWSEYLNNLFFADGVYHNASNVEDYINEETVIYGPGRGSFSEAVPSLMVSLGFLGTLLGLTKGLSGFSLNDSEAAMSSIVTLIPGMRYAFMTSIFGVIGSIAFTLLTRAVHGSTQHTLRVFYGAMSRYAGVLSVDPMTQVAIYQQEQTALIRKISNDLSGRFADDLGKAVEEAVEPLQQSFRNFVSVNTKEQMRFLDAVATRFVEHMDDALNGELKHFSKVLQETASYQEETFAAVKSGMRETERMLGDMQEVAGIADDMVRKNSEYIRALNDTQKQAAEAYGRMASYAEQMDLVARQQNTYLKTVNAMQADVTRSVEQMTGAVANFTRDFAEENANASDGMLKAAAELRTTGAHLEAVNRDFSESINRELKSTLDAYQDYVNQFTKRVDYLAKNISDSVAKLPRAVDKTSGTFLDQMDQLNATLADAQNALQDAVDRLYGENR